MYIEDNEIILREKYCIYKNLALESMDYFDPEQFNREEWFFGWGDIQLGYQGEDTEITYEAFVLRNKETVFGESFLYVETPIYGAIKYYHINEDNYEILVRDEACKKDKIIIPNSIYIDLFEIKHEYRNSRMGEAMFEMFKKMFPNKTLTLTYIDPALRFWLRRGFKHIEGSVNCEMILYR